MGLSDNDFNRKLDQLARGRKRSAKNDKTASVYIAKKRAQIIRAARHAECVRMYLDYKDEETFLQAEALRRSKVYNPRNGVFSEMALRKAFHRWKQKFSVQLKKALDDVLIQTSELELVIQGLLTAKDEKLLTLPDGRVDRYEVRDNKTRLAAAKLLLEKRGEIEQNVKLQYANKSDAELEARRIELEAALGIRAASGGNGGEKEEE